MFTYQVSKRYKISNKHQRRSNNPDHKWFHLPHGQVGEEFRFVLWFLFSVFFILVRKGTVQECAKKHDKCKTTEDSKHDSPAKIGQDELIKGAQC